MSIGTPRAVLGIAAGMLALGLSGACESFSTSGRGGEEGTARQTPAAEAPRTEGTATDRPTTDVVTTSLDIRLRAGEGRGLSRSALRVRELVVRDVDSGTALAVIPRRNTVDLGNPDNAWLVGTVRVPSGVRRIEVSAALDEGWIDDGTAVRIVDTRGAPIRTELDVDWARSRGRITIEVDARRSFVATGPGAAVFLPHVRTQF